MQGITEGLLQMPK